MSLYQAPVLYTVPGKTRKDKVAISFVYNYAGDAVAPISAAGLPLGIGSLYTLNVAQIQGVRTISAIKSLLVSMVLAENTDPPGFLWIYVPATGMLVCVNNGTLGSTSQQQTISVMIPLVTSSNPVIQFIKGWDPMTGACSGQIAVTAFNFRNQPFVIKS